MSDVEIAAADILKPMLVGQSVVLGEYEQITISAWLTLRAMIFEHAHSGPGALVFHTRDERQVFGDIQREGSLEPPEGAHWWLFQHKSRRWLARSSVLNLTMRPTPNDAHHTLVINAFVGEFGFQLLTSRWPTGWTLDPDSAAIREWEGAMLPLWPNSGLKLEWPPAGGYLADDTIKPFKDRWNQQIVLLKR